MNPNQHFVIYGFPRSGTKLLASIFAQNSFHNYGEFFDTWSSTIVNDTAVRADREVQRSVLTQFPNPGSDEARQYHRKIIQGRIELFKSFTYTSSVVTLWSSSLWIEPLLYDLLKSRFFLCPCRKNRFEQLLSRCLTNVHLNFNNEVQSTPTTIKESNFKFFYKRLCGVEQMQKLLVGSGNGVYVDFDEMITGDNILGMKYKRATIDEHSNLYGLVSNLSEIQSLFVKLESSPTHIPVRSGIPYFW